MTLADRIENEATTEEAAPPPSSVAQEPVAAMRESILQKLYYMVGKTRASANDRDWYVSTALAVRDKVVERWHASTKSAYSSGSKRVYYLSLEFLIGRQLREERRRRVCTICGVPGHDGPNGRPVFSYILFYPTRWINHPSSS